mmetsp:Transcript_63938/g.105533  ORF Transcript_63938/g.105533 Transcript_63938/m.105533 type:complete len:262 (+) Transcript_63938:1133-1918(+)
MSRTIGIGSARLEESMVRERPPLKALIMAALRTALLPARRAVFFRDTVPASNELLCSKNMPDCTVQSPPPTMRREAVWSCVMTVAVPRMSRLGPLYSCRVWFSAIVRLSATIDAPCCTVTEPSSSSQAAFALPSFLTISSSRTCKWQPITTGKLPVNSAWPTTSGPPMRRQVSSRTSSVSTVTVDCGCRMVPPWMDNTPMRASIAAICSAALASTRCTRSSLVTVSGPATVRVFAPSPVTATMESIAGLGCVRNLLLFPRS